MAEGEDVRLASARTKLTYRDFLRFPDDGRRHELIDGEHYVTPSPNRKHQAVVSNLHYHIRAYLEREPRGRIFTAPFDVIFSFFDIVEPDLLYISHERAEKILTHKHVRGAPDLVIEISSPSTRRRDELKKRRLYERCDVTEYWVVDPDIDAVRVYRRDGDRFGRAVELRLEAGDTLTTPLLPGLTRSLDKVFQD